MKEYFETLELNESKVIKLGNNEACKVHATSTLRLKMYDNHEFLLCCKSISFLCLSHY